MSITYGKTPPRLLLNQQLLSQGTFHAVHKERLTSVCQRTANRSHLGLRSSFPPQIFDEGGGSRRGSPRWAPPTRALPRREYQPLQLQMHGHVVRLPPGLATKIGSSWPPGWHPPKNMKLWNIGKILKNDEKAHHISQHQTKTQCHTSRPCRSTC